MKQETMATIDGVFEAIRPLLERLAQRWADESEYEDIADYKKVIESKLPSNAKLIKMTKRPFGFHCAIDGEMIHILRGARTIGWKQLR